MRDKYIVRYYDNIKKFRTKNEIMQYFQVPLYIIDKIIKKTANNDVGKCHMCYEDIYSNVDITVIKPTLIDLK